MKEISVRCMVVDEVDICFRCFEAVTVNDFTRHTVLAYIRELKDILTATRGNPRGDDLAVCFCPCCIRVSEVLFTLLV
jgi:hypothetical protein